MATLSERRGIGAAPGRATGPIWRPGPPAPAAPAAPAAAPVNERRRLTRACTQADAALAADAARARSQGRADLAEMIDAQRALLADPHLARDLDQAVEARRPAAAAVAEVFGHWAARLDALEDDLLRQRAEDMNDLARRLGRLLAVGAAPAADPPTALVPYVLVADALGLTEVAALRPERVLAIATERGGALAHAAIVARSLGIPAVVGLGPLPADVRSGLAARVDGDAGTFAWGPTRLAARVAARARPERRGATAPPPAWGPVPLSDGTALAVLANIASEHDARAALQAGADGVGLWRTEWLAAQTPDMEETALAGLFAGVASRFAPRPVTVRLPDLGGDKARADSPDHAANPALALRGVRLLGHERDLFARHARAMVRAAARAPNLRWMVPMVVRPDEVRAVRRLVGDAVAAVEGDGQRAGVPALGAMVEVPAAAVSLARLAAGLSFVSIGTNDLAQYALAADRDDPRMGAYLAGMDPAVLSLVAAVVRAAGRVGLDVSVCGELAGEAWAVALFLGVGVRTLSAAPDRLGAVRAAARRTDPVAARALARRCLGAPDGDAVRRRAEAWLSRR